MIVRFGSVCEVGPVRCENQDRCLASDFETTLSDSQEETLRLGADERDVLLAVADGMGGAAGGALAAETALEALASAVIADLDAEEPLEILEKGFLDANAALLKKCAKEPGLKGMGTTMTAALLQGGWAYVAHVGDSRLYLLRKGELSIVTSDHSYWTKLKGYEEDAARKREGGNLLVQCVGGMAEELLVELTMLAVCREDRLLLCSDGLHGAVERDDIARGLGAGDAARAAAGLYSAALCAGTQDNVTALVAQMEDESLPASVPGEVLFIKRAAQVDYDPQSRRLVRRSTDFH